jgi:hypothetical protein
MKVTTVIPCKHDRVPDTLHQSVGLFSDEIMHTPVPGLGPAYLDAWAHIEPDWLALHVDVGHAPDAARDVLDEAVESGADLVIGSRLCVGGSHQGSWKRRAMSVAAAKLCNAVSFYEHTDWTSGLRAYSPKARRVLSRHDFQCEGHAWQMEALWVARQNGLRVKEVPIDYVCGNSSLNAARVREAVGLWRKMALSF